MNRLSFRVLGVLFFLLPLRGLTQLTEDFSDRNINSNPVWIGDDTLFSVTANEELQSQGMAATETIYLATAQNQVNDTEWRIDLTYAFAPSTSNFIRIYLIADQSNFRGSLQGYYVQAGESGANDSYDLYRQDGNTRTKIIDGIDGRASTEIDARLRVIRKASGEWELYTDLTKTDNYTLEGTAMDNTYATTSFFGLSVRHSATRANSFFFDNIFVGDIIQDNIAPSPLAVNPLSATELEVSFSETIEEIAAENTNNYKLLPGNSSPVLAQLDAANLQEVSLSLANSLVNGNSYELVVSGMEDLNGNLMQAPETLSFVFFIPEVPAAFDVVINEIFADPTPSQGLPEAEYLELINRSNKVFDLENWTISNGSTRGRLPAHTFRPGDIVILARDTDAGQFSTLGTTLSPDSWTTLVNGGDNLGLRSASGILMDTLDYESSWFRDAFKEGGGFSLERINPDNLICPPIANWTATQNSLGGTPGISNSVFDPNPESEAPSLLSVAVIDNQNLRLCFDESMNEASIEDINAYDLRGIGAPVSVVAEAPDFTCITLSFSSVFVQGQTYQLEVNGGVEDCSGNPMGAAASLPVVLARPAQAYEIVITEVFPDFSPVQGLPEAEYVEIYNRSDEVLDLSGAVLSDGGGFAQLGQFQIFSGDYIILCAREALSQFRGLGQVVGLDNFPSLGNGTDSLTLFAASGTVLDYVYYSDSWYQDPDKSSGGFSLERIDPDYIDCNQPANWRASQDLSGGTPGRENSIDGEYTDDLAPFIVGIRIIGLNGLEILFSEQMDITSLENNSLYSLDQGIGEPVLALAESPHFTAVRLSFDTDFQENVLYTLSLTGLGDCAGNTLTIEYPLGLPLAADAGDILLNEILFNPRSGGSDYVEIINVSEKVIDLASISIGEIFPGTDSIFNSDRVSRNSFLFLPGQILCLTPDVNSQIQQYQPIAAANFLEMSSFPTYADASGEAVVFSDSGKVMDRFYYEDDFHYPTLIEDDGVSLERLSLSRSLEGSANWHSAASTVRFGTPGYANSQAQDNPDNIAEIRLDRDVFTPDLDGLSDVVAIQYNLDIVGATARISVLDSQGRLIKIIQQNALLGSEPGAFYWDGSDAKGTKADLGIYVILVEVSVPDAGTKDIYKLPVVLAAKF